MMKKIKSIVAIIMTAILMTVNCSCVLVSADSDYGIDELFSDLGNLLAIDRQLDSYGFSESQKDDIYALGILYGIGKAFEDYSNQQSSGTNQNNTESENSGEQKYDSDQENSSEETVQYIGSFTCNPDELTFDAARWTSENYGYEFYTPEDWKRMDNDHQDPSIDIISDKDGNTQMVLAVQDYGRELSIDEIAQMFSKEEDYTVGGIVNINGLEMVYAEWNVDGNPVPQFAFESPNNPGKMLTVCYTCSDPDIAFQIIESFKAI